MNKKIRAGTSVFVLSMLACQPVFAIGWKEVFFVFILIAFLIGPPVYRFIRKFEKKDK
jgi:hypothetical protein